jgi:AcrR family transcriptional regulator
VASSSRKASRSAVDDPAELASEHRDRVLASGLPLDGPSTGDVPETTKSRILDEAITLFAERGFDACTMRDLAAVVGIKAPAIYNHYASKDVVLAEAMQQILGQFFAHVLTGLDDEPPAAWLATIVRRHIMFQLSNPRHTQANDALMSAPSTEDNLPQDVYRRIVGAERDYIEIIRAAILVRSPGLDRDDALIAAFSIAAMCDRVASWFDPDGPLDPGEIADRHLALVERMVGA